MSDPINPAPRLFRLFLITAVILALSWVMIPTLLINAGTSIPPEDAGISADIAFSILNFVFLTAIALATLGSVFFGYATARGVNLDLEWRSFADKQKQFSQLVNDMSLDKQLGAYSDTERIRLAMAVTYISRNTLHAYIDTKKLGKREAENRGISRTEFLGTQRPKLDPGTLKDYNHRVVPRLADHERSCGDSAPCRCDGTARRLWENRTIRPRSHPLLKEMEYRR